MSVSPLAASFTNPLTVKRSCAQRLALSRIRVKATV
jgi:hypothetical protein